MSLSHPLVTIMTMTMAVSDLQGWVRLDAGTSELTPVLAAAIEQSWSRETSYEPSRLERRKPGVGAVRRDRLGRPGLRWRRAPAGD